MCGTRKWCFVRYYYLQLNQYFGLIVAVSTLNISRMNVMRLEFTLMIEWPLKLFMSLFKSIHYELTIFLCSAGVSRRRKSHSSAVRHRRTGQHLNQDLQCIVLIAIVLPLTTLWLLKFWQNLVMSKFCLFRKHILSSNVVYVEFKICVNAYNISGL